MKKLYYWEFEFLFFILYIYFNLWIEISINDRKFIGFEDVVFEIYLYFYIFDFIILIFVYFLIRIYF